MGASHAVHWLKLSFSGSKHLSSSQTRKKEEKIKRKMQLKQVPLLNAGWHPNTGQVLGK